jgi:hypothetical protein
MAIKGVKVDTSLIKVEKLINLTEKMISWDVLFQTELVKQCVLLSR